MPRHIRVKINKNVVEWAAKRSNTSLQELSEKKDLKNLEEWINKESMPTYRQAEKLARSMFIPVGYLFFSKPPKEKILIPYFRTIKNDTNQNLSPNLMDSIKTVKQRQDWIRDYLIAEGVKPLKFVNSAKNVDPIKRVAHNMRTELGLDEWVAQEDKKLEKVLNAMLDKIEDAGIFILTSGIVGNSTRRPLNVTEFRGFVMVDKYAPFIFINGKDSKAAQMFTIAHELAHIWFGKSAVFDLNMLDSSEHSIEKKCNQIAAEFLVPEEEFLDIWTKFGKRRDYNKVATHFRVSNVVAVRRAYDLNMINRKEFIDFYNQYITNTADLSKKKSGGDFYRNTDKRIGKRFAKKVIEAVRSEAITYRDAYNLTGLRGETFDKYAKQLIGESI